MITQRHREAVVIMVSIQRTTKDAVPGVWRERVDTEVMFQRKNCSGKAYDGDSQMNGGNKDDRLVLYVSLLALMLGYSQCSRIDGRGQRTDPTLQRRERERKSLEVWLMRLDDGASKRVEWGRLVRDSGVSEGISGLCFGGLLNGTELSWIQVNVNCLDALVEAFLRRAGEKDGGHGRLAENPGEDDLGRSAM